MSKSGNCAHRAMGPAMNSRMEAKEGSGEISSGGGHTRGPWDFVGQVGGRWLIYPESARNDGIDYFIAETFNVFVGKEKSRANARLMAAAPDLLAACEQIAFTCEKSPPQDLIKNIAKAGELARAALTKAGAA